jgi:acetyl esterase
MLDAIEAMALPPLRQLPVQEARARAIAMSRRNVSAPPIADAADRTIPGPGGDLKLRIFTPPGSGPFPVVVYFHGGGYVLCNLDTHDLLCREICHGGGCIVVAVDYRLAPEHKYPAATDDCLAATRWAADNALHFNGDGRCIAVAGDSCGGNLATVTCLRIRDEGGPALRGQLLFCPITDYYDPPTPSYIENAEGYLLTRDSMIWFLDHYLKDPAEGALPYVSPLRYCDLGGLPPALVITAEFDPLRDEGDRYAGRLAEAGVLTEHHCYAGMIHGFYGQFGVLDRSRQAIAEACAWLRGVCSD